MLEQQTVWLASSLVWCVYSVAHGRPKSPVWLVWFVLQVLAVTKLGVTVIATFVVCWSPWLTSLESASQVGGHMQQHIASKRTHSSEREVRRDTDRDTGSELQRESAVLLLSCSRSVHTLMSSMGHVPKRILKPVITVTV